MAKKTYTAEEKEVWKKEQQEKQRKLLEDALAEISSSEAWGNWVRFGRSNLRKYSFNNALLIYSQKKDATLVHGAKQWEKEGVSLVDGAKKIWILAPMFYKLKDKDGQEVLDTNGQPQKRVFFRSVFVFDVKDTTAPEPEFQPLVELEGDDLLDQLAPLEAFARELGILVRYREDTGKAHGYYDEQNSQIIVNKNLSANGLVRTLVHELCHAYGNVNYKDYSREEAEVLVESATVMALGMIGFDVREASVPYILEWGGDLKVLDKFAKLVDELVSKLTKEMSL